MRLPEERWQHIVEDHHEMALMEEVIGTTLLDPDLILRDTDDPATVRLYYRRFLSLPVGDHWICVVVKVSNSDAYIITAYPATRLKRGETLWTK